MRYIPQLTSDVIIQVPEDKNAYINVRTLGASGRGDIEFTGTVTDISDNIVTISNITDGGSGTLNGYLDILRVIRIFSYSATALIWELPTRLPLPYLLEEA